LPNGSPLPSAKFVNLAAHDWLGRRWEWVDPLRDMNARIAGVGAGLMAPQDLSAQMGRDFYDTMVKIKEAQDLAKQLGIVLPAYESKRPASAPAPKAATKESEPVETTKKSRTKKRPRHRTSDMACLVKMSPLRRCNSVMTSSLPKALLQHLPTAQLMRSFVVERSSIDEQARTVKLAFASETPVERSWFVEILDLSRKSMRTGRLTAGANLLCDHDTRDVVAVVESVEIGTDKVARAVVRFGRSVRADEVFRDVVDGIRVNVSVGYIIHGVVLEGTKDGLDTYRVTDWEPYELSLVSVPADVTVGVGRSLPAEALAVPSLPSLPSTSPSSTENRSMTTPENKPAGTPAPIIETPAQRNHASEISQIAAAMPGGAELAMRSIQAGHTVEQFQAEAIRALSNKPVPTADIGLSKKRRAGSAWCVPSMRLRAPAMSPHAMRPASNSSAPTPCPPSWARLRAAS
jgi:hypothetical protein